MIYVAAVPEFGTDEPVVSKRVTGGHFASPGPAWPRQR